MFKLRAIIPVAQCDGNGVEFSREVYTALTCKPVDVCKKELKTYSKGVRSSVQSLGQVNVALRGHNLLAEGLVSEIPTNCQYLRLAYAYKNNKIDPKTVKLIFSEDPGVLRYSNYTAEEVVSQ